MKVWGVTPIDSPTTCIRSTKRTIFGEERYELTLTDFPVRRTVRELTTDEFTKKFIEESNEKLKDRL